MSEFREDLLISPINKKRVIGIILVAILLMSAFAFSSFLFSLLWGGQRPFPSDKLSDAEDEDVILVLPPFPYNFSDFQNMNLTTDQLSDLLDMLQNMFDGNVDDLDLSDYAQGLAALMASEIEVFRVYDYNDFNNMSNNLWRYECFDEYLGDSWQSTAISQIDSFYPYMNYSIYHSDKDIYRIQMPLSPSFGINSMVIPSLFPTPFIMNGSVQAPNLVVSEAPESPTLYKDDLNCVSLSLNFDDTQDVNMSYELFGLNLPSNDVINNSALSPSYTPSSIQNRYLNLPPTIQTYLSNNPNVYYHYLILNNSINENDNTFMVANKIRNYLQYAFSLPADLQNYSPAPAGRDVVDYFCETQEGLWSDFASAFCVFCRIFGVASRFVDGFNSLGIEQIFDNGQPTFAIKYRNIYNWGEIFVPTDVSGRGRWIQMDVLYDNYGTGGNPWSPENYTLTINTNFTEGYRNNQNANITATLSLLGTPIGGRTITFIDYATDNIIGQVQTNTKGDASLFVPIDNAQVAGLHPIMASYNPQTYNFTQYLIYGGVNVSFISLNPQEVNISISTLTNAQGYVFDPLNNIRVRGATLEFVLFYKNTNIRAGAPPFDIVNVDTDSNGEFNVDLNVDPSVPVGIYQVRVDFNGSFYGFPIALGQMNASSQRVDLNITKGVIKKLWFYINDFPSNFPTLPSISRYTSIQLKAIVLNETNYPLANQMVEFYDYRTHNFIDSNMTNANGITTIDYPVGNNAIAGPNLLYAKLGILVNHSYFILNEAPTIHILSGPDPPTINRTGFGATTFNVKGEVTDSLDRSKKMGHSTVTLKLLRGGSDYSSYLQPLDPYPFETGSAGYFDLSFGVEPNTPTGNYTLRLDFDGIINMLSNPDYPHFFNLPLLSNSTYLNLQVQITSPATLRFDFYIDGFSSVNYNQPEIPRSGGVNLSAYLEWDNVPIADGEIIQFYDVTQGLNIGSAIISNGSASRTYNMTGSSLAGPHLIRAQWGSYSNYSYFILNAPLEIDLDAGPNPREIYRSGSISRTFNLQGFVIDSLNGQVIKYPQIHVSLYDGITDVSYFLVLQSGSLRLTSNGFFDLTYSVLSSTPAKNYTIRVGVNGIFLYSSPNNQFNEHDFYLSSINFSDYMVGLYELKVIDPDDININFWIDKLPTLSYYDDAHLPQRYNPGEIINFTVYITQSGSPVGTGTVILTDAYTSAQIGIHTFSALDNGYHEFLVDSTFWYGGLHNIEVQWSTFSTYNSTYVIINKTISISADSSRYSILRNQDNFNVFGLVRDGSIYLRGLQIEFLMLDAGLNDVSSYLNLPGIPSPPYKLNVYDGSYQYNINSISLNCPQGIYYFRIDFNGTISAAGIYLNDYMIHVSSNVVQINVTTGTYITGNFDTKYVKDQFYEGDDLYSYGYLRWDNNTAINNKQITVSIKNSLGSIITSINGFTDINGFFNITIVVGNWPNDAEVWVSFTSSDNFSIPERYYIESTEVELYRA
jgi:hypothetical protein